MDRNSVLDKFYALPQDAQQQVIDFIAFLQTRYESEESSEVAKPQKITDEAFVGIWKNRKYMEDSSAWVREMRKNEWGKRE